ncbi:thiamine transporter 1 [Teleopsis dalmanni]|uniref:thiamine transporter 1 n=1 Tax=Teleopsis dalmanni TaxID=139649 RepID=UPI0018CF7811|nr:thiamine transporter 1 [Teleopsis dalmanni]
MQAWLRISLLLCSFGFFREMRPSEPFVTEYLTDSWHNITSEQVNKEIYPFGTYAVLSQLVIVFLVTDILRYKPIIVLSACAGIILFAILSWTNTIPELQIGQIFYGFFMASEVAYYTYIYAKVDKNRYQIVTGHTRSAILAGKFLGGVLAQILISTESMDYRGLHFISFGSQVISLFIALTLPAVNKSLYFFAEEGSDSLPELKAEEVKNELELTCESVETDNIQNTTSSVTTKEPKFSWSRAFRLLLQHTVTAYSNPTVVKWSFWWALATCGQVQVISYVQFLWKEIDPYHESFYNGAVEATVTLLGAVGAMTAGFMNSNRHKEWHMWILTICSLLMGAFLIISAITNLVWIAYAMYVLFGIFYFFVITIATAIVAENLCDDSFGLIFGINTLVALALQTILTLVVVTDAGYALQPRSQYIVYGSYFVALAILYCLAVMVRFIFDSFNCWKCKTKRRFDIS